MNRTRHRAPDYCDALATHANKLLRSWGVKKKKTEIEDVGVVVDDSSSSSACAWSM